MHSSTILAKNTPHLHIMRNVAYIGQCFAKSTISNELPVVPKRARKSFDN